MARPTIRDNRTIYQAMAEAFAAEGVDTHFLLTGHGQMHWAIALAETPGLKTYTVRHEHASVSMATGYYYATGKVGVASTTCGPGFTQVITALTSAVQARVPLVIFAAETALGARWSNQLSDQAMLTKATGAHFIQAHSPQLMMDYVQEAFYVAQFERRPVVISTPYDLMDQPMPSVGAYVPSSAMLPEVGPMPPNPDDVERAASALAGARRPVIVAGRGAMAAAAAQAIEALAEKVGAVLGTTLPARGLFDHNPFSIGVIGGYSSEVAKEVLAKADCLLCFGASLTHFTTFGGRLFPEATVIQVDQHPLGLRHGRRAAHRYVRSDACLGAEAIGAALAGKVPRALLRTAKLEKAIRERPADGRQYPAEPGILDPRAAMAALDDLIPKDWDIVSGAGNSSYFYTHWKGRHPRYFHVLREFGAVGSALAMGIGVAAAKGHGKVVILDGDGGVMMHIQELESIRRHNIRLMIVTLNDGGFGAEFHRLRPDGMDDSLTFFGRPDFASITRGFGLKGATVTELGQLGEAVRSYDPAGPSMLIDLHVSDKIDTPGFFGKGGH